jgi:hypothetical protein
MSGAEEFDEYLSELANACPRHFYPGERYHGKEGQLRFVRESFAHVFILNSYTDKEIKDNIGKCYGCLVRCLFMSSNKIEIDSKQLVDEVYRVICVN